MLEGDFGLSEQEWEEFSVEHAIFHYVDAGVLNDDDLNFLAKRKNLYGVRRVDLELVLSLHGIEVE